MSQFRAVLGDQGCGTYNVDWQNGQPSFNRVDEAPDGYLVPGFVDIHIHGAFGIDFMSATTDEFLSLCDHLAGLGYEAFLPTTVTASADDVRRSLAKLPNHPMIRGFHLEGPFLSTKHPGAQNPKLIVPPDSSTPDWDDILDSPQLRIVTLAPEVSGGLDLTRRLASLGVIVSLGHTDADYDEAEQAWQAGALHTTHTFNAMRPLHHRKPGCIGSALTNDNVRCEVIYDRTHVVKPILNVLLRCKGLENVIAVSDSTAATGLPAQTSLSMWGQDCVTDGKTVRLTSNGALAGSSVSLLDCFQNLIEDFGMEVAVRACSLNPRRALSMKEEPTVWIDMDENFQIREIVGTIRHNR